MMSYHLGPPSHPPYCPRCGLAHWTNETCSAYRADVPADPSRDAIENASIRQYESLRSLDTAVREAEAKSKAYERLERSLRLLGPS